MKKSYGCWGFESVNPLSGFSTSVVEIIKHYCRPKLMRHKCQAAARFLTDFLT